MYVTVGKGDLIDQIPADIGARCQPQEGILLCIMASWLCRCVGEVTLTQSGIQITY